MNKLNNPFTIAVLLFNFALHSISALVCHTCVHRESKPNPACLEGQDRYGSRSSLTSDKAETVQKSLEATNNTGDYERQFNVVACATFCGLLEKEDAFARLKYDKFQEINLGRCRSVNMEGQVCACNDTDFCNNRPSEKVPGCPFKSSTAGGDENEGNGSGCISTAWTAILLIILITILAKTSLKKLN